MIKYMLFSAGAPNDIDYIKKYHHKNNDENCVFTLTDEQAAMYKLQGIRYGEMDTETFYNRVAKFGYKRA